MRGLFGALAEGLDRKSAITLDSLPSFLRWPASKTGITVGWSEALHVTTVLACVSRVADGVAMAPWKVLKPLEKGGAEPDVKHPLFPLLYRRPNRWQTSFDFRRTLVFHRMMCGNAFIFKSYVENRIYELIPVEPGRVRVIKNADYTFSYEIQGDDGSSRTFSQKYIWHLRGPSWNSWMGMDPMKLAREAIGLALATEESHALLHKNGGQTPGIYSVEGKLDADQHKALQDWIDQQIGGANRFKPLILDSGGKYLPTTMTGVDSQHLETRRHQIEEICRALNVRPIMVMHSSKEATFASAEQMFLGHVVHTLNPWWEEITQSADVNLIEEGSDNYTKFNASALLHGSMEAEAEYFAKALGSGGTRGWMTQNQVRALKDWNPLPGGDELPMATNAVALPAPKPSKKPEETGIS
jgi:HK97 family phage portal protein